MNQKADSAILFLAVLLALILLIAAFAYQNQHATEIEAPIYFTITPDEIDWGNVTYQKSACANVTNTLNQTSAPFNMTSTAPDYLRLTWNMENQTLQANETRTAVFTVTRAGKWNVSEPFKFKITIWG